MLEIWLAFSAGLAGSGHCLGMCGGIVTALALSKRDCTAAQRFMFNLLYHAGRICTYTLLGLLAGLAARAGMVDALAPLVKWLFLGANILVAAIGVFTALGVHALGMSALDGGGRCPARVCGDMESAGCAGLPLTRLQIVHCTEFIREII